MQCKLIMHNFTSSEKKNENLSTLIRNERKLVLCTQTQNFYAWIKFISILEIEENVWLFCLFCRATSARFGRREWERKRVSIAHVTCDNLFSSRQNHFGFIVFNVIIIYLLISWHFLVCCAANNMGKQTEKILPNATEWVSNASEERSEFFSCTFRRSNDIETHTSRSPPPVQGATNYDFFYFVFLLFEWNCLPFDWATTHAIQRH